MDEFIGGDRVVTVLQTHGPAQEISRAIISLIDWTCMKNKRRTSRGGTTLSLVSLQRVHHRLNQRGESYFGVV